jgi:hypothetical protein
MELPSVEEQIEFFEGQIEEVKKSNLQNYFSMLRGEKYIASLDQKEFEKIKQAQSIVDECKEMIERGSLYIEVAKEEIAKLK